MDAVENKRLNNLNKHVFDVYTACCRIGITLAARGEYENAKIVIYAGSVHDESKRSGIEFEYLNDEEWPRRFASPEEEAQFKLAVTQHNHGNSHHPESWPGGIHEMPPYCVYEMVADWFARSHEQGTDLWRWVHDMAMPRFGFTENSPIWNVILDGLCILGVAPNE